MGRLLVKGTILAVLLYAGMILGIPYYQYVMMERAVEEAVELGAGRMEAMRIAQWGPGLTQSEVTSAVTTLMQTRAERTGLELPAEQIRVSLEQDLLYVRANWETEAALPGYTRRFHFRVEGRRIVVR